MFWGCVIDTELILTTAKYSSSAFISLALLILALAFGFRLRLIYLNKQRENILRNLRPQFANLISGTEIEKFHVPRSARNVFMYEWNNMFGLIRGEKEQSLIRLGYEADVDTMALHLLKSRNIKKKLLGIMTLGHLRDRTAWDALSKILDDKNTTLSLAAALALVWIDTKRALDLIGPKVLTRHDWPWSNLAHIFKQADSKYVCSSLAGLIDEAPKDKLPGLLRFVDTCNCEQAIDSVQDVLNSTEDDRVASTCLHITNDPRSLRAIRRFTLSDRWHVRMHAASALGRLGDQYDTQTLMDLCSDKQWWVRYRAAQALADLLGNSQIELQKALKAITDPFSKDIVRQVSSEIQIK